ncbi:hypothetical protein BOX15_Mlig011696g1 [Macrostomum lignano]|uniref:Uncharacterized protein n=1 Tax=Macrostomum lignano TaxID=282301 RepID=A0A267FQY6_9PLAT|nr:hypothetical protein BOX15_Mlig018540g1 [Macrostomum lignano]PAA76166.1 hypothetical protein BOX15_Mlig011696g2 [Macrostomum lignano]PAA93176.1 hypothetical protein BOX15_Mlig011696g1 [Macrostomum lignano]
MEKGDELQQGGDMSYQQPSYAYSNPVLTQPQPQQMQMNSQVNITMSTTDQSKKFDHPRDWTSGLCGCCEDFSSCCCIWLCGPCYLCCCLSERMGESCCTPVCLSCAHPGMFLPVLLYRTKLRSKYNIRGSAIDDCCCAMCCSACTACQIKRELDYIERSTGLAAFA